MANALLRTMLVVVWAIWAPVGFFLWIPLLIRATLLFAGLVVHAVITGENPHGLRTNLEAAIDFWFYGFRIARATVLNPETARSRVVEGKKSHLVLLEILWAIAVWLIGLWVFTPGVLHRLYEALNHYLRGLHELWVLVGVGVAVISFILGRLYGRDQAQAATHSGPGPEATAS